MQGHGPCMANGRAIFVPRQRTLRFCANVHHMIWSSEDTVISGANSGHSSAAPARLHQHTWYPNDFAPAASHAFEETNKISDAGIPSASGPSAYTRGDGL